MLLTYKLSIKRFVQLLSLSIYQYRAFFNSKRKYIKRKKNWLIRTQSGFIEKRKKTKRRFFFKRLGSFRTLKAHLGWRIRKIKTKKRFRTMKIKLKKKKNKLQATKNAREQLKANKKH
jgi:hypothetical protein